MNVLLPLFLLLSASQKDGEATAFDAAFALKKAGQSAESAVAFETIAKDYPSSPRVGEALVEAGVGRFAVGKSLQVFHRCPPESTQAFQAARALFARVVNERPEDPHAGRAQSMIGSTALFQGDLAGAEAAYTAVLDKFPKDAKYVQKSLERRAATRRHLLENELALADLVRYLNEFAQGEDAKAVAKYRDFATMLGKPAPPLAVETWLQGEPRTLESLRGHVVALCFLATWCENCEKERAFLIDLEQRTAPRGVVWIGVFDHQKGQKNEKVRAWLAEKGIHFAAMMDASRATTTAYHGVSIPDLVLIDGAGLVRWHDHPANLCDDTLEMLLGEAPAARAKTPGSPPGRD